MTEPDDIDLALLRVMRERPKAPVTEIARRANVARGTAHARINRMEADGLITGYGPELDLDVVGYGVLAFTTLQIAQGQGDAVVAHLAAIPEVLEVYAVTGSGDLSCRVVARSNAHLHEVLQVVLDAPGIQRTETQLALHKLVHRTGVDLVVEVGRRIGE